MADKFRFYFRSHSNDLITRDYPVNGAATAANWSGVGAEIDKWVATGAGSGGGFYDEQTADDGLAASTPLAQKDLSAVVELRDNVTGGTYIRRIPMPDLSKADDVGTNPAYVVQNGVTVFNPAHADYATLVTQIETHFISDNGNAVTVQRIYIEE